MSFDTETGEYIDTDPENSVRHLVIDLSAIDFSAEQFQFNLGKYELEVVAEEAAHTLQDYHDPGILYRKKDANGKYRPLTKSERNAADQKMISSESEYLRNYESSRNEREAKKLAREATAGYKK